MRTRKYNWFDFQYNKIMYGFQVKVNGRWMNCMEDGKALIFHTKAERDLKRREVRKIQYEKEI